MTLANNRTLPVISAWSQPVRFPVLPPFYAEGYQDFTLVLRKVKSSSELFNIERNTVFWRTMDDRESLKVKRTRMLVSHFITEKFASILRSH